MKTFLVPTDFSVPALNAVNYAFELAMHTHSKLILFYAWHTPPVTTEIPVVYPSWEEIEAQGLAKLEEIKRSLTKSNPEVIIECVCQSGFAVDQVDAYAREHKTDMVIMGMQGAGYLSEILMGSITTAVIKNAAYPVLVINEHVKFKAPKNILFAADLKPLEKNTLAPLKELAILFKSQIYPLHVCSPSEISVKKQQLNDGVLFMPDLNGFDAPMHFSANENPSEGIQTFISETDIVFLCMVSRKHSFLESFFQEPETKKMAFHTKKPLLVLKDN